MHASKSGMIFGRRLAPWILLVLFFGAFVVSAQTPDEPADTRDTLVYKDGDRIRGHLIEKKGDLIVFKSDRFGELRVPASDAVIIKGEKPAAEPPKEVVAEGIHGAAPRKQEKVSAEEREEEEKVSIWNRYSPAVLTAKVRDFFGPWHGHLSFSNELVTDTAKHDNIALDGKLSRKFTNDTVDLSARYDYDQINGLPATDDMKGIASWRHDFTKRQFTQYRPTIEWDRANGNLGQYVLLQQEFGYGFNLLIRPTRKLRVGVSENMFDIWGSTSVQNAGHSSRAVASLFDEAEVALPWRMSITQRGVWYPESEPYGWEDRVELNKKLTETLSVGVIHEIRRHAPDARDYERLKLLLGLDF